MKKARYVRVSTIDQSVKRQTIKASQDELVYIDKISGSIPFHERPEAKKLLEQIKKKEINYISVSSIDRLGRNNIDVLTTIEYFHSMGVTIYVDNLGLESIVNGKISNPFSLIVSVMSSLSQMERESILERQREGIAIAKLDPTKYKGRASNTKETSQQFILKYKSVTKYLKQDNPPSLREIAKLTDVSLNTVQKVKKLI